uniref:Exonuclease domain-containing protein n=1 Tax=Cyprinodon variegatus TaxID=28743 RepID=A0A3Q2D261_CYPVA
MKASLSPSVTCGEKKRKNEAPAADEGIKRLKTEEGGDLQERPRHSARLSVCLDRLQQPITPAELMELLHFAALGKAAGIKQPSWCRVHHQRNVSGINVVVVEGVTQSLFYKHYLLMEHLRTKIFRCEVPNMDFSSVSKPEETLHTEIFFPSVFSVFNSANSSLNELHVCFCPAVRHHPVITTFGTKRRGLTAYVLSQQQLIKNRYPVKAIRVFFISCHWTKQKGYELARVSLVDSDGNCVLDDLVKPQNRVLNYLTQFSGITAAMLRPVTTTLRDVQAKIRTLLPDNAVVVGHSLNNDLVALKLIHQHVIDTSLLYRREFGQKFKLKVLAEVVLKRQIQSEERSGHNPTEDAVAALELAQYFIKAGPRQVTGPLMKVHRPALLHTLNMLFPFCSPPGGGASSGGAVGIQTKGGMCANLREMCAVFAGPFPAGFSKRDVKRMFSCCGPVRRVQMLSTSVRMNKINKPFTAKIVSHKKRKIQLFSCSRADKNALRNNCFK